MQTMLRMSSEACETVFTFSSGKLQIYVMYQYVFNRMEAYDAYCVVGQVF